MFMKKFKKSILFLLSFCIPAMLFSTQPHIEDVKKSTKLRPVAPKVFLDGRRIDSEYIRTEISFVDYVRERTEADVHVLITTQNTGSGGSEYTIAFIGQNGCKELQNTLKFFKRDGY